MDTFPDLGSLTDAELKDYIQQLEEETGVRLASGELEKNPPVSPV